MPTQQRGEEVISQENEQLLALPLAGASSAQGTAQVLSDLGDPFDLEGSLLSQCPLGLWQGSG